MLLILFDTALKFFLGNQRFLYALVVVPLLHLVLQYFSLNSSSNLLQEMCRPIFEGVLNIHDVLW